MSGRTEHRLPMGIGGFLIRRSMPDARGAYLLETSFRGAAARGSFASSEDGAFGGEFEQQVAIGFAHEHGVFGSAVGAEGFPVPERVAADGRCVGGGRAVGMGHDGFGGQGFPALFYEEVVGDEDAVAFLAVDERQEAAGDGCGGFHG